MAIWRYLVSNLAGSYCLLAFSIGVTIFIYYPALESRFFLDDLYNLNGLGDIKTYGIVYYVFDGFSGPSGRPLSLLSFALQYQDWPNSPAVFKAVNLLFHLLNGVLIWFVCRLLSEIVEADSRYRLLFCVLTTMMWLVHPIQFSTVLYVIQRMTELSTLFTLLGILGYLHGRRLLQTGHLSWALILMSFSVWGGTLLAILCKENGVLLPLFIVVMEVTLLPAMAKTTLWKGWALIFLLFPLLVLITYMVVKYDVVEHSYGIRNYTLAQRLLTQPGILLVYLKDIIAPTYGAFTLYHDDYPVSTSLMEPGYTLPAIAAVLLLLFTAILLRKRLPLASFAILWFFAGHALESSHLNLELYFEHRNYLPSFGICAGISWLFIHLIKRFPLRRVMVPSAFLYYMLIISVSVAEANTWSKPVLQAVEWARKHPGSVRALSDLAAAYLYVDDYDNAMKVYDRIDALQPDNIYTTLEKLKILDCKSQYSRTGADWETIIMQASVAQAANFKVVATFDSLMVEILNNRCHTVDPGRVSQLLLTLIENPAFSRYRGFLFEYLATLELYYGNYNAALAYIRKAVEITHKLSHYLYEIRLLKLMQRYDEMREKIAAFKEKMYKDPRQYFAYNELLKQIQLQ